MSDRRFFLLMKSQFVPFLFRHEIGVHAAFEVLLRNVPARRRVHVLVTETLHVLDHVLTTFAIVIQRKGSFLRGFRDEDLLASDRHDVSWTVDGDTSITTSFCCESCPECEFWSRGPPSLTSSADACLKTRVHCRKRCRRSCRTHTSRTLRSGCWTESHSESRD